MGFRQRLDDLLEVAIRIGFLVIPIIILYMAIGLLLAFPVQWIWSWVIPDITSGFLGKITYWQAWGLIVLSSILFGNTTSGGD